ncbi:hypothetical protein ACIA58_36860 [Kribbella sp. NPDC051586]|uniref:hypothetical protein n=1 Tax=Kribbella sp. NPDC051586 TaxID=3364118 RepID=UPI0037A3DED4
MSDSDARSRPEAGVKIPRDPEGPVPGEVLPTAEEEAAQAVMQWLTENRDTNAGSVSILDDHKTVVVYWKGDPPTELQQVVASQPVPVSIRQAPYSRDELVAAARSLLEANKGVISSAGPNHDFSAVSISLSSKAPETALATLRAQSAVPIEFRGVQDITYGRPSPRTPDGGTS